MTSSAIRGLPKKLPIAGVKKVITVTSAKGGVGKSTITVNLALAASKLRKNENFGILDLDVFGPSIPRMMNLSCDDTPLVNKQNLMVPFQNFGVSVMSMGFLVNENDAVVWRGLMVMQAVQKLLRQVAWPHLDYLFVDMPPGTGDVPLSLSQNIPIDGAVIVTTPQNVALSDARRGFMMFEKLKVPVLGIVENMSFYLCPKCGHEDFIFGKGGAEKLGKELKTPILGEIPLNTVIQNGADCGKPVVIAEPESFSSKKFEAIAEKILSFVD